MSNRMEYEGERLECFSLWLPIQAIVPSGRWHRVRKWQVTGTGDFRVGLGVGGMAGFGPVSKYVPEFGRPLPGY
jgi:hypothetical protein